MKKILLVEDTVSLAEEIADIIRLEGYEVRYASTGNNALVLLDIYTPHLIITDLLMPGMNGFDFIRNVRAREFFTDVPILILSAKVSIADQVLGEQAGANLFVQKPCKTQELLDAISRLLGITPLV